MNIKSWWENLLDRERRILSIAGVLVGIFLIYAVIWSPLSNAVVDRKTQVQSQKALLQYMRQASTAIQNYRSSGMTAGTVTTSTNLLSVIEQTASTQDLSSFIKQVKQLKQNEIELTLEAVPFDKLMQWLQLLSTSHGISVTALSATRLPTVGTANATVTLSVGK
ncbi:MAG: hypothetical protein COY58_02675 [Gammaproteobacteria bacterium CG_4_10_14_0_8_um_filter_38_16]|nr:MAG: hypothetical protein COY58_02675 [Gammaproteobacteria bacterium CG_4_10_14_0_8_um_filter_38_16]PJA03837.1 MAG: hypothetical protein COX72_02835 [Gammaproteobacteria bacterium CG_4_10_14_0_2_um_filter_38_22]PJB10811.1 MAG: hypothetical protein CO120_02940 [Gammaproteobacteria bacterium CG_4_9_14_3_um_filter_38_9]